MASLNKVQLIGRLGRDPETRYTSSGVAVCNFSLATDESFKDNSGEKQKKTEWHRIVLWKRTAEVAQEYLHKGDLIYLEGKLQTRQWEDKQSGQKRESVEIIGFNLTMLNTSGPGTGQAPATRQTQQAGRPAQARPAATGRPPARAAAPQVRQEDSGGAEIGDEDIPF